MDNTAFNKMLVVGDNFPEDRMISYAAHVSAPLHLVKYADDLAARATIETKGNVSTMTVGDSAIGWFKATKDLTNSDAQWVGRRGIELGRDDAKARLALATNLVCDDLNEAYIMRSLRDYDLDDGDILEAAMYPGASLTILDEDGAPEFYPGDFIVHGYVSAPQSYFDLAKDFAKTTITNDEQTYLIVGSKDTGFLAAIRNEDSGVWESRSTEYPGYNICHSADKNPLDIAKELCSDLAVFCLDADDIADQILDHGLRLETLDFVEIAGTSHVVTFGDGYKNMPDPNGVFRNILGRLGGHDPA